MVTSNIRHNSILSLLSQVLRRNGHEIDVNMALHDSPLRPDIVVTSSSPRLLIDVTVPFDTATNLFAAYRKKIEKYQHLCLVLPFVVGALGAWLPSNDEIKSALGIPPRAWNGLRRRARLLAIQGTTGVISSHLTHNDAKEDENELEDN